LTFGEYLRNLRRNKGISQRDLAQSVGVSFTYLSKIENEKLDPPSEQILIKIAKYINIDPDTLIIEAKKVPLEIQDIIISNPNIVKLIRAVNEKQLDEDKWEKMIQVIKEI